MSESWRAMSLLCDGRVTVFAAEWREVTGLRYEGATAPSADRDIGNGY
jgi:hypothetical protein